MSDTEVPRSRSIPFTVYDSLGYVVPGGLFFASVYIFEFCAARIPYGVPFGPVPQLATPLYSALTTLYSPPVQHDWLMTVIFGLSILATTYTVGHIIASASSFLIDRILVCRGFGYPYTVLLDIRNDRTIPDSPRGAFYRAFFFWSLLYSGIGYLSLFQTLPARLGLPYLLLEHVASVAGWLILACVITRLLFWVFSKYDWRGGGKAVSGACLQVLAWVGDRFTDTISRVLRTGEGFDRAFREKYEDAFTQRFGLNYAAASTNNFWLSYIFVVERSKTLASMLGNWLTLYGFSRNISAGLFMSFAYLFIQMSLQRPRVVQPMEPGQVILVVYPLILLAAAGLMLIRYYYLFHCYYTKFTFRAFVFLQGSQREASSAKTPVLKVA